MPIITDAAPIAFASPLPSAVDVVVIGAGVVGTSTAYFLAKQGKRVALIEKGRVAGEQSSRNWGWVRQQGRDAAELPIMMEANRIWTSLASETGQKDLTFTAQGCLYVAATDEQMAKYEHRHDIAKHHQLDTRMLSAAEVNELVPGMDLKCAGGMITPTDGRAEPFVAVPALARSAQALGAAVIEGCAARTIEHSAGQVTGVATEKGLIQTDAVVLAGGAWSTIFLENLGVDLPQLAVRSTVGRTHITDGPEIPNLSMSGLCIRKRADGGYSVATGDLAEHYISRKSFKYLKTFMPLLQVSAKDVKLHPWPPDGYPGAWNSKRSWSGDEETPFEKMRVLNPPPSPIVKQRLEERMPKLVPWLKDVRLAEIWAGMIDVTPDAVPYVCEVPSRPGVFVGTGMSGHGFGIGPAIGKILSDMVRGQSSGYDLSRFRFERFTDGSRIVPGPY